MRILITAGPTREPLDAVRVLSNRSSGRMGISVALEAFRRGHEVTLLLGRGAMEPPSELERCCIRFETTADLQHQLEDAFPKADLLIMAAAVADFIPETAAPGTKLSRHEGPIQLTLQPAPDLVAGVAASKRPDQRIVGFALEPAAELDTRARAKLVHKNLDAIVANPLETMDAECITATLIASDGKSTEAPVGMSKSAFAAWLLDRIAPSD
ncbi:MAG: phosphopantothenoylcysteine decarboxylase [Phycisphaerales bacterium]|nr:phosphopantothenoylcysteine decarboxylase [Phycisphaerales bacterium]